jgi:hypothetical protein
MAVTPAKIRMGAADSVILFGITDLGGTIGGVELDYTPTVFQIEVDQVILPVRAVKTKEECSLTCALAQTQMSIVEAAFGIATTAVATVAAGTLTSPTAPTVTPVGAAGAASYTYTVVAFDSNGDGIASPVGTTATGNAALGPVNYNQITWAAVPNATGYKIIRTIGGTTQGLIGTINAVAPLSFNDTGLVATAYTNILVQPATPNVDTAYFGGNPLIPQGTLDWSVPKLDGTPLKLRGHFNQCVSFKAIKINFSREKTTELNKVSFLALADLTQPVGQEAGSLKEEY